MFDGPNSLRTSGVATDFVASPPGLSAQLSQGIDIRVKYRWADVANQNLLILGTAALAANSTFWMVTWNTNGVIMNVSDGTNAMAGGWQTLANLGNPAVGDWVVLRRTYDAATGTQTRGISIDDGQTWTMTSQAGTAATPNNNPVWVLRTSIGTLATDWAWIDLRTFDGTPVASCDLTHHWGTGVTSKVDPQGNTWTLNGTGWAWQGPEPEALHIMTAALPDATIGQPYSATLEAMGGVPPYSWAVTAGTLPAGLTLDPNSGQITGIPL